MNKDNYPKVLFVDDEKNILNTIKRSFIRKPFKIFTANSGKDGLLVLEKEQIDVVVSDVKMPEMDGIQFLTKVKERHPNINRIILSGYVEKDAVINAILTGVAFTYLTKPWDNEELFLKLQYVLNISKIIESKNVLTKINKIEKLPDIPELYQQFIDAVTKNLGMQEIAEIISKDISLTTKIIQIVNSAFYSAQRISSLETAVNLLGLNNLKSIIFSTILLEEKSLTNKEKRELIRISEQSYRVNKLLQRFYKIKYGENLDDSFKSLGLIYEVGKLILIRDFSEEYFKIIDELKAEKSIDFYGKEMEHGHYGCTYREIGGYFLHLWNFSEISVAAALYNFDLDSLSNQEKSIIEMLQFADKYVKYQAEGMMEDFYQLPLFNKMGLTKEDIAKVLE